MKQNIHKGRSFLSVTAFVLTALNTACSSDVQFGAIPVGETNSGLSGTTVNEEFTQGYQSKLLDVVVIVDNSLSMAEEQAKMGDRISSFLGTLHDVDWQMAITTTDVSDRRYGLKGSFLNFEGSNRYILNRNTPGYETQFRNTIIRSETLNCGNDCPSGDEQALRAMIYAIEKRNTDNANFFRNGADIAMIVLSDEDEMSTGPVHATKPESVIQTVRSVWGDSKRLFTYGMITMPGDTACHASQGGDGHYGMHVADLAQLTGGIVGSICAPDYSPTLGLIGERARQLLEYVQLSAHPNIETVKVSFTPAFQTDWHVDGNRIYFDNPPPKGTKIRIAYEAL